MGRHTRRLGLGLAVALVSACGLVSNFENFTGGKSSDGGLAKDREPPADVVPDGSACENAVPPEPPGMEDLPSRGDLVFAADDLRIDNGEVDAGLPPPLSLDLDRACSCRGAGSSCVQPAGAPPACDDARGRDNAGGSLLADLAELTPSLRADNLRARIREGDFSFLVTVQNWNGTENDPSVLVNIYMSAGAERGDGARVRPRFDGTDIWSVESASVVGGDALVGQLCPDVFCAGSTDLNAYVRDGLLVARFPLFSFRMSAGGSGAAVLPLVAPTLTARLSKEGGLWRLTGEIAGRLSTEQMLLSAGAIRDPIRETPLCENIGTYGLYKTAVCSAADLAADPARDGLGDPCAALSESIGFSGVTARLGRIRRTVIARSACAAAATRCGP